jgi:hypothetical protein
MKIHETPYRPLLHMGNERESVFSKFPVVSGGLEASPKSARLFSQNQITSTAESSPNQYVEALQPFLFHLFFFILIFLSFFSFWNSLKLQQTYF